VQSPPRSPDKLSAGSGMSPVFVPLKRSLHPVISTPMSRKRKRAAFESLKRNSEDNAIEEIK
jgi:hypothetical protein